MTATYGQHARKPGLGTVLRNLAACLDAWLLGATGGRHERPAPRPEFGADEPYAAELRRYVVELEAHNRLLDTAPLPVVEDVTVTGFEPSTGVLPVPLDLEDAALWDIPRGSFVLVDPTEVAFTAGAHLLDGV